MDFFWTWFYQQLEKQPEEEADLLRQAAEEALETPPGMEPREIVRLLQSRIGNQAMQRLLRWKEQRIAQRQSRSETEPAAATPEPEETTTDTEVTPSEQEPEPSPKLSVVIHEGVSESERTQKKKASESDAPEVGRPRMRTPTAEEKVAVALQQFLGTLIVGGRSREWHVLAALFKEIDNPMREKVITGLIASLKQIERTAQQLFMSHLITWRDDGDDDLATRLWLRLRFLAPAWVPVADGDGSAVNPVD